MWPVMLTRYSCLQRYILTMTTRPRSLFTKRADWSKHRDPTVQEWLKHFSAKEEEQKKKASVAYIPSPKARARTALILSWYRNGAVPWEVRWRAQLGSTHLSHILVPMCFVHCACIWDVVRK